MKSFIIILTLFAGISLKGQPLINQNYSHIYDPAAEVTFNLKLIKAGNNCTVIFTAGFTNGLFAPKDYQIEFEVRQSLTDKEGTRISVPIDTILQQKHTLGGRFNFQLHTEKIFVAKVTKMSKESFFFWQAIPEHDTPYLVSDGILVTSHFTTVNSASKIGGFASDILIGSIYTRDFPAAAPPFSVQQARVTGVIKPDSIFTIQSTQALTLATKGLYLFQSDTTSATGLAFRVESDYPKLGTIGSLIGPMVYVCTRQEYEKLKKSYGEKKKFDQVILSITGDADRAKNFMKNYFYRVELANLYFSSYKEGWKTDRGMIFVIYGLPTAVYLFGDKEVWEYKNAITKETFEFTRSATIFDQDNFVLKRQKRYEDNWYQSIDLWRKSRF